MPQAEDRLQAGALAGQQALHPGVHTSVEQDAEGETSTVEGTRRAQQERWHGASGPRWAAGELPEAPSGSPSLRTRGG